MKLFNNKNECCGCMACVDSCPKGAITQKRDARGFDYPVIDSKLCVNCGLCTRICAFKDKPQKKDFVQQCFAVKHRSQESRMQSSSGGIYTALTDYVIGQGGVVYGAAFTAKDKVVHTRCETLKERNRTRSAKYVQSDCKGIYTQIKADLRSGRMVLFSGTPCQTAEVGRLFEKYRDKLILVDIICHGVPSPMLFEKHIQYCEKKASKPVLEYHFRSKQGDGRNQCPEVLYQDGTIDSENEKKYIGFFPRLFLENKYLRVSCFRCPYSCETRSGDITIGDFWGIRNTMPDFDDGYGVSAVILNSAVGKQLFELVGNELEYCESSFEEIAKRNPNLKSPSLKPKYPVFWVRYALLGWDKLMESYAKDSLLKKIIKRM